MDTANRLDHQSRVTARQDAHDRIADALYLEHFAENVGIGSVARLPKFITEDGDIGIAFSSREVPAEDGIHSKCSEEFKRYLRNRNLFRFAIACRLRFAYRLGKGISTMSA